MTHRERGHEHAGRGIPGSKSNHPKYVFRYTSYENGDAFAEGIARRRTRSVVAGGEPEVAVAYDLGGKKGHH